MFTLFDLNKNGLHDQQDVLMMADGYNPLFLLIAEVDMTVLWEKMYVCALLDGQQINSTLLQTCLADLGQVGCVAQITVLCAAFLPIFDTNFDTQIEEAEYKFFFSNLKLPENVIDAAWPLFQGSSTGKITLAQFTYPWANHFFATSCATDPFNFLLGPVNVNA